jgi:hypothetical protein
MPKQHQEFDYAPKRSYQGSGSIKQKYDTVQLGQRSIQCHCILRQTHYHRFRNSIQRIGSGRRRSCSHSGRSACVRRSCYRTILTRGINHCYRCQNPLGDSKNSFGRVSPLTRLTSKELRWISDFDDPIPKISRIKVYEGHTPRRSPYRAPRIEALSKAIREWLFVARVPLENRKPIQDSPN